MVIINLSAYRFVSLDDLPALRERVLERCEALALKGTILLAPEGINLFLAGPREPIDTFMHWLCSDPRFAGLEPKESISDDVPFGSHACAPQEGNHHHAHAGHSPRRVTRACRGAAHLGTLAGTRP